MLHHLRSLLFAAATVLTLPALAQAQCVEVPNTGCPGSTPPQCSGSTALGQSLSILCLNSGRATVQFLLLGTCSQTPFVLPAITCVPNCVVALELSFPVALVNTGFAPVTFRIPSNPAAVGATACLQCFELNGTCLSLSPAVSFTITP